jgi:NAD(P)-dependent dehydrogenase (short-subunit alcohol dehydrogenase family)
MGVLDGTVSVITGGASGIGAETVRLFVSEGARVVIADVLGEDGERLAAEMGDAAVFSRTDVSREDQVQATIDLAVDRFGRLDCLFNNAGFAGVDGMIEETDGEGLERTMGVLFSGVVFGMKHAAPIMKRQGSGSIISTASVAAVQAGLGPHIYSAAKAAVVHLTRSVAVELAASGIRVNCICPGGIATPIFGRQIGLSDQGTADSLPVLEEALARMHPIRRSGQPQDIAQAALWLASDASSFVCGHALVVDGGATSGRSWTDMQRMYDRLRAGLVDAAGETAGTTSG